MSAIRLAILGAGSVRCALPVVCSLATYFGERPFEIVFYDADEERLDLIDRFARLAFVASRATHSLSSTYDPEEAMKDAEMVVVQVGENCARKMLHTPRDQPDPTAEALVSLMNLVPDGAYVLSLLDRPLPYEEYYEMSWPPEPTEKERIGIPHQILRFLNQEDYMYDLLKQYASSPLKAWLNEPTAKKV